MQPQQQGPPSELQDQRAARPPLTAVPAEVMGDGLAGQGWQLRVMFERRDLWVGVFWDRKPDGLHLYLCPLPTVALHAHRRA